MLKRIGLVVIVMAVLTGLLLYSQTRHEPLNVSGSLNLSFTAITDESIDQLLRFKKLTTLRLLGTRITRQRGRPTAASISGSEDCYARRGGPATVTQAFGLHRHKRNARAT